MDLELKLWHADYADCADFFIELSQITQISQIMDLELKWWHADYADCADFFIYV